MKLKKNTIFINKYQKKKEKLIKKIINKVVKFKIFYHNNNNKAKKIKKNYLVNKFIKAQQQIRKKIAFQIHFRIII